MEFSQPKGIYQQIAEQMRDRILAGEWHEGERIPSVRELAVGVGVNPNTVTKSYQALLDREIIENQRGLGYFVAADAKRRILDEMREEFVRDELPRIFRTMRVLGMQSCGSRAVLRAVERRASAMRNSQRAVLGALGFLVALMLGVAVWIRLGAEPAPELSGERAPGSYDYSGFTGGHAVGCTIERGDASSAEVRRLVDSRQADGYEAVASCDGGSFAYDRARMRTSPASKLLSRATARLCLDRRAPRASRCRSR